MDFKRTLNQVFQGNAVRWNSAYAEISSGSTIALIKTSPRHIIIMPTGNLDIILPDQSLIPQGWEVHLAYPAGASVETATLQVKDFQGNSIRTLRYKEWANFVSRQNGWYFYPPASTVAVTSPRTVGVYLGSVSDPYVGYLINWGERNIHLESLGMYYTLTGSSDIRWSFSDPSTTLISSFSIGTQMNFSSASPGELDPYAGNMTIINGIDSSAYFVNVPVYLHVGSPYSINTVAYCRRIISSTAIELKLQFTSTFSDATSKYILRLPFIRINQAGTYLMTGSITLEDSRPQNDVEDMTEVYPSLFSSSRESPLQGGITLRKTRPSGRAVSAILPLNAVFKAQAGQVCTPYVGSRTASVTNLTVKELFFNFTEIID